MKVICPRCNMEMEDYGDDIYHCNFCSLEFEYDPVSRMIMNPSENINEYVDVYQEYDGVDDSQPDCCVACGNPAYPDCMDSCKIFDT